MKNSAHSHHPSVNQVKKNLIDNKYTIRYVASPAKTYLVNPKEGEIDYSGAYTNFGKFFKKVQNQPIVKYRITMDQDKKNSNKKSKWFKNPNIIMSKETTRPRLRSTEQSN